MKRLFGYTFLTFLLLFAVYIALAVLPNEVLPTADRERIISDKLSMVTSEAWTFVRPLLQLAFIIVIFEYVFEKYGAKFRLPVLAADGDVQALLAVLVIGTFCVAALAGSQYSGELKDAALVIIGFYFGTRIKNSLPSVQHQLPGAQASTTPVPPAAPTTASGSHEHSGTPYG